MIYFIKRIVKFAFLWDSQKYLFRYTKTIVGKTKKVFQGKSDCIDQPNFEQVLAVWRIKEKNLSKIKKIFCVTLLLYVLLGCWGMAVIYLSNSYMVKYEGLLMVLIFIIGFNVNAWKLHILINKRFIPFKDWILFK